MYEAPASPRVSCGTPSGVRCCIGDLGAMPVRPLQSPVVLHPAAMPFPMRSFTPTFILAMTVVATGCASRPAPRVAWLGDGVFKSPTVQEAEAYCRNFGAPMRFLDAEQRRVPAGEVTYRCD